MFASFGYVGDAAKILSRRELDMKILRNKELAERRGPDTAQSQTGSEFACILQFCSFHIFSKGHASQSAGVFLWMIVENVEALDFGSHPSKIAKGGAPSVCSGYKNKSRFLTAAARRFGMTSGRMRDANDIASLPVGYCSLAYSALASFRMGTSGSASFQRVRKS
jgi:hypothetical protein